MALLWSHCVAIAKVDARAATFIVSWNWMNFWIFLYTHLLHLKTVTTEVNNQDDNIRCWFRLFFFPLLLQYH